MPPPASHPSLQHVLWPGYHIKSILFHKINRLSNMLQPNSFQILEFLSINPQIQPVRQQNAGRRWRASHPTTFRYQGKWATDLPNTLSLALQTESLGPVKVPLQKSCDGYTVLISSHQEGLQQEGRQDHELLDGSLL